VIELSVIVPAEGEPDAGAAVGRVAHAIAVLGCAAEILCVTSEKQLPGLPAGASVTLVPPSVPGYGAALATGFARARGAWLLTIDADILDVSRVVPDLWARRHDGEVVIGSRYVDGGSVEMPWWRRAGSRLLNGVFGRGLSLGVRDMSSGVRLYRRAIVDAAGPLPAGLDALQTILVRVYAASSKCRSSTAPIRAAPRTPAPGASRPTTRAPSGGCGSCATRSHAPTTTPAPTTARFRCSATGSTSATGT
jgi:dolichol-phosphate mannosyltransferase